MTGYAAFNTNVNLKAKGNVKETNTAESLKSKVVTSGDGLYLDITEVDRYIYKGVNPDNYIMKCVYIEKGKKICIYIKLK